MIPTIGPVENFLRATPGPLIATAMLIAEEAHLTDQQAGPVGESALYRSIIDRELTIELSDGLDDCSVSLLSSLG